MATLLLLGLCVPYTILAQDTAEDEIEAHRKKTEELLDTASAQMDLQQYEACQKTLERCSAYEDNFTSSQRKRYAKYGQEAQSGLTLQRNAEVAIQAGAQHLMADRLGPAEEQFKIAYNLKKYLPAPRQKKIEDQLKVIKAKQKLQKKSTIALFKKSKSYYKAGQLDEAGKGFTKVQQSGIKLGFFDTGDFTSTAGYLKKIAGKREKLSEAERKRQQELIEKQEEQEKQRQKQESTPSVVEPTPKVVEPTPKMVEPTPKVVEPTPKVVEPMPKMVEPTPKVVEPTPKVVEPTPKVAEPTTEVMEPTPKVVEPTPKVEVAEDELTQAAAPTPGVTPPPKQEPKETVEPTTVAVEKKKKFDPFGFLKKKKEPEKSPATLTLINQKMALANQAWTRRNYAQAKELYQQVLALDPENAPALRGLSATNHALALPSTASTKPESTILDRLLRINALDEHRPMTVQAAGGP